MPAAAIVAAFSLETLFPTPPASVPTTAMIRDRVAPAHGERQRVGEVSVPSRCRTSGCLDGLRDDRSGRTIVPASLTHDERIYDQTGFSLERAIAIAGVTDRWISIYLGVTEYSGGAHSNNSLECVTFSRASGRRVSLADAVGKTRAAALVRAATDALTDESDRLSIDERSFVVDSTGQVSLCAADGQGSIAEIR